MNDSDIGYWTPENGQEESDQARQKRILADGLLSRNSAFKAAQQTLLTEKRKTGLVERVDRSDVKLLTNDGRELLNS